MIKLNSPSPRATISSLKSVPTEPQTPMWKFKAVKRITFPENLVEKTPRAPVSFIVSSRTSRNQPINNDVLRLIQHKVDEKMDIYLLSDEYQRLLAAWRGDIIPFYDNQRKVKSLSLAERDGSVTKVFEEVMEMYQLQVTLVNEHIHDSALTVNPLNKESLAFSQYLNILLIQMTKFPHTFFRKVGLRIFSFCDSVILNKSDHKEIYYKRALSGLFEVEKLKTLQEIKLYFYKLICYHIAQTSETFHSEWMKINQKGFNYTRDPRALAFFERIRGFLNYDCMKSLQMDQAQILEKLILDHNKILNHEDDIIRRKAELLMEHLLKIDPSFHSIKGWEKISSRLSA